MDFNGIVEGTTVYLQVHQPGALLYFGDGHALQGDGELNGNALETSMDVEVTVDLIPEKRIATPRVESPTHIMAVGLDGSLEGALKDATSGMAQWLEQDYGLTPSEVAQVLGTASEIVVNEVAAETRGSWCASPRTACWPSHGRRRRRGTDPRPRSLIPCSHRIPRRAGGETVHDFDEGLARRADAYVEDLFVPPDDAISRGLEDAEAAGLPSINVSPNEGKLLHLIARITRASRVLEIGTLGGYSTTWLARALPPGGRLVTLELEPLHAEVARANLARAGVADRVEIRIGPASASLRALIERHEPPFDLVFIDADKEGYVEYLELSLRLVRRGSVILADNTLRRVFEDPSDPGVQGIKAFNERIASHPRLDSLIVPIIRGHLDGLSISIVE